MPQLELGATVEIAVTGRIIARTESLTRGTTYLIEYGRDNRREWFSEDAILEDDDNADDDNDNAEGGGDE